MWHQVKEFVLAVANDLQGFEQWPMYEQSHPGF